jgi:aspartate kinase
LTALAVGALADAQVEVLGVHQLIRSVDIMFVLAEQDYEKAVVALHRALIEERQEAESPESRRGRSRSSSQQAA